jgi:magnesium transporter
MAKKKRRLRHTRTQPGAAPGTLVSAPERGEGRLHVVHYGPEGVVEEHGPSLERVRQLREKSGTLWLDVTGLGDAELVGRVGDLFGLHPLALEDVLHVHQRAKVEDYGSHYYFVARVVNPGEVLDTEQLSLFFGERFVVTFQERAGDPFEPVREGIRAGRGRLRSLGADYLAYRLLDAAFDPYFPQVERIALRLDTIEEELLAQPRRGHMQELFRLRRELLALRRAAWPLRDALQNLLRASDGKISPETLPYLRDAQDHAVQALDMVENERELATGLIELHLAAQSQRMNEVMKVLTIISTIFIPLTFVVGVYGMNFDPEAGPWSMPELKSPYGYAACLAAMAAIALSSWWWFRHRGWIGRESEQ